MASTGHSLPPTWEEAVEDLRPIDIPLHTSPHPQGASFPPSLQRIASIWGDPPA